MGARNAQNILTPPPVATERFTDATAAVARLEEIYERNVAFLRECFESYLKGEPAIRVRATYPFVRITTETYAQVELAAFLRICLGAWHA